MYFVKVTRTEPDVGPGPCYVNMARVLVMRRAHRYNETYLEFADGYNIAVKETPEQLLAALPDQSLVRPS